MTYVGGSRQISSFHNFLCKQEILSHLKERNILCGINEIHVSGVNMQCWRKDKE
jgi:uncharacterized protein (DUF342 family)